MGRTRRRGRPAAPAAGAPPAEGAESPPYRASLPVTAITISPGHVTDRLPWRVVAVSHSHGGVGESRGWSKHRRSVLIFPFSLAFASRWTAAAAAPDTALPTMADRGVDVSALPKEVRDQLAELDLELSEGKVLRRRADRRSCGGDGRKRLRDERTSSARLCERPPGVSWSRLGAAAAGPGTTTPNDRNTH